VQDSYKSTVNDICFSRNKRGDSLDRRSSRSIAARSPERHRGLRRTHSEDLLLGPGAKRSSHGRRKRGEVNLRIVDFAHTTTGRDYVRSPLGADRLVNGEIISGKGYQADIDPETGLIYARFPPHHPEQPDLGFLFGLKNLAASLEKIWEDERARRYKLVREGAVGIELMNTLSTEGGQIFEHIFGTPDKPGEVDEGIFST
jgi:inositol-hexakisphosphate kinase